MSIKGVIKIYLENQFLYTDDLGAVYMFNYGNANEAQKEAISAIDGLVLITAGPVQVKHLHLLRGRFISFKNVT